MVFANWDRSVPVIVGTGCAAFATFRLADRLGRPRRSAVADVEAVVLRQAINEFQDEQLEYLRFYTTPEWRTVRLAVFSRYGPLCRQCSCRISPSSDVAVRPYQAAQQASESCARSNELAGALSTMQLIERRKYSLKWQDRPNRALEPTARRSDAGPRRGSALTLGLIEMTGTGMGLRQTIRAIKKDLPEFG